MARFISTLLSVAVQFMILNASNRFVRSVFKPYGPMMCKDLCKDLQNTFIFVKEDLSCQRAPAESKNPIKTSASLVVQNDITALAPVPAKQVDGAHSEGLQNGYINLTDGETYMCIKFHDEMKTWFQALQVCMGEGATLLKLDSMKKEALLKWPYRSLRMGVIWIGLHDVYGNDTWYWTDGTRSGPYTNWARGEPNSRDEFCVNIEEKIFWGFEWNNFFCKNNLTFVCERTL